MKNTITDEKEFEPDLITSQELARRLSMSVKFIEKHRQRIYGAIKIGRVWRFSLSEIRARLATGRDIVIKR